MSDRTFGRKKAATSTFSNPSLVSPTTPTLANPTRSFGLPTNNASIQRFTEESTNQEEAQFAGKQSLEPQAIEQWSFGHDISRIPLRRPQAKLTVGEPGDKYEQEADWVANQVMRMVVSDKLNAPTVQPVQDSLQRKCSAGEQEEEKVQTKLCLQLASDRGLQAGDNIESQIKSSKGGGSLLSDEVRGFMEPRFSADFSSVRVHTDSEAVQMNRELGAQAFTHGSDIYFGSGKSPGKNDLTAHELTHVVQQTQVLQRKSSACQEEDWVMRQEEESSSSTSSLSNASQSSNTTDRLLDLITRFEQLHTHSNQQIGLQGNDESPEKTDLHQVGEQHLDTLSSGLNQLRAVAASNDETLKQRVLAAFTPSAMQTAQTQASSQIQAVSVSGASLHPSSAGVLQQTPVNIATKSLTISSQQDGAEIEADQVAKAVISDQSVTVNQRSPEANISRLAGGETLIALGTALLVADAEAAPVEVVAGPPGWAIGLGIAAVAVVAIGIGYAISSSSTDSQPVTDPVPAPDTSTSPIPVPVPIPVPQTRRWPNQTCENDLLDDLQKKMHEICDSIPGDSCSPSRVSPKKLARRPCSAIRTRIKAFEDCRKARDLVQKDCFGGVPDERHLVPIENLTNGLNSCKALEAVNCVPGHPMADL